MDENADIDEQEEELRRSEDDDDEFGPPPSTTGLATAYQLDPMMNEEMRQLRTNDEQREDYCKR